MRVPRRRGGAAWRTAVDQYLPAVALVCLLLVVWQWASDYWQMPTWLLPSPLAIAAAGLAAKSIMAPHIWQTVLETWLGLALALAAGLVFALLIDLSTLARRAIYPLLIVSQTVPIVAIAPLLVIWFGYGILPKILVIGLVCFFPIVVGTADGLRAADPDLISLLCAMGANRTQILTKVRIPGALPSFFSGLKIAVTYSVIGAIIGEWVGASKGLGVFMLRASNSLRTDWVFAAVLVTSLLSLILFLLVTVLERLTLRWLYAGEREEHWEELQRTR